MAMSKTSLRDRIKSKWEAKTGTTMTSAALDAWEAVADAIIEEIQTNAAVTVTSVSGVTTGVGTSGPGTGTIA
jgi:hypothetical protein